MGGNVHRFLLQSGKCKKLSNLRAWILKWLPSLSWRAEHPSGAHWQMTTHLITPRPATEPWDALTRNYHNKYQKKTLRAEILEPRENTPKIPKAGIFGISGVFFGILGVFWGYFLGVQNFGRGGIFRYCSRKFRIGASQGPVAGRRALKYEHIFTIWEFRIAFISSNCRYRIVLPEELISTTETDLWECWQN